MAPSLIATSFLILLTGCSAAGSGPAATASVRAASTATAPTWSAGSSAPAAGSAAAGVSSSGSSSTSSVSASPLAAVSSSPVSSPARYVFPVRSKAAGYGKYHHDYPATDIFAPCGSPVLATTGGQVADVSRTDKWSSRTNRGADRGGLSVAIIGVDGVRYYASHLRSISKVVVRGAWLTAGEVIGATGNTGDARGIACHVHYGISPNCGSGDDWWNRRGVLSPYRFLKSWQAHGELSPAATVKAWRSRNGCPKRARSDP